MAGVSWVEGGRVIAGKEEIKSLPEKNRHLL